MEDQDKAGGRPITISTESYSPAAETRLSKSCWTAEGQELLIRILAVLNRQITDLDPVRQLLGMVKEFTGVEAVGIRLRGGEDFPYFVTKGFPGHFVEAENFLCSRTEAGEIIRDTVGNPVLECMCGNVIRGRTNPSLPFFTEGGSFWTNSTTELLASTTEKDRQARTRNRCNGEGYESVALIPLRSDREVIGLLQLNDYRQNCFSADMIRFFEGIGASIGIVLARAKAEEALGQANEELEARVKERTAELFRINDLLAGEIWERKEADEELRIRDRAIKTSITGIILATPDGTIFFVNDASVRMWGFHEPDDMVGLHISELHPAKDVFSKQFATFREKGYYLGEIQARRKDGSIFDIQFSASSVLDDSGKPVCIMASFLDISDRKQAEEALRKSETKLRLITETIEDVFWMSTPNITEMIYVSPSYEKLWGRTCKSLYDSPRSFMEAIHPGDRERITAGLEEHAIGHYSHEYRIIQPDGTIRWIQDRGFPIRDEIGNLQLMTGVARDITDRKRAEEALLKAKDDLELKVQERTAELNTLNEDLLREIAERKAAEEGLREQKELLRAVLDALPDVVGVQLPDHTILRYNRAGYELLGLSPEEVHGRKCYELIGRSEECRPCATSRALQSKRLESLEKSVPELGRYLWCTSSPLLDQSGEVKLVIERLLDITERKKAEAALRESEEFNRRLVDHAPFGIVYVNRDGTIEYVNPAVNRIGGIPEDQATPILGRNILELPGLQGRSVVQEGFSMLLAGESISDIEVPYKSSMGRDTVLLAAATPRFATDGTVAGAILMFTDISERVKAEELQRETAGFRAVADLACGVAHNFNNLLQIVIGNVELALMDLEAGNYSVIRDGLEKVLKSSLFGAEVVRRLQMFSQHRQLFQASKKGVIDVSDIARQAVEVSQVWLADAERKGIKVYLHTRLKQGCLVNADKNAIFGVLVNLVRNAVEALPAGGDVDLTTAIEEDKVVLQVRDTGVGISQENLGRVFNPFFTTKAEPGAGLSLANGRKIVDDCGGRILVDSTEGRGTSFTVFLPLAEKLPEPTKALPERETEQRLTILVIDDMEAITDLLKSALTAYGHAVLTALSGEEGIEIFKENPADVVISDLGMPGMSGWEVGKRIRAICQDRGVPKTPFILLTAWSSQEMETEKIAQGGVDAIVGKPLKIQNIREVIRQVVERRPSSGKK